MAFTYEYPRMMVTVDAIVFLTDSSNNIQKILLIKRKNNPYKDLYALPGGFPEMDELLVDAAKRELLEETGLTNINLRQFHAFDAPDRDPRGRNVSVAFVGITTEENSSLQAGDDAGEADWFPIDKIPPLAFDHKEVVELALNRLKK